MPGEVLNFEPEPRVTFGVAGDRIEAVIVAPEGHHLHAFGTAAVARGWARALLALADAIDPQPRAYVLDPAAVENALRSDAGEKSLVDTVGRNAVAIRKSLNQES